MSIVILILIALFSPLVGQPVTVVPLDNPAGAGSIQPNLTRGLDGALILSWLEPVSRDSNKLALKYSVLRGHNWSKVITVVASENFKTHPSVPPAWTDKSQQKSVVTALATVPTVE